MSNLCSSHPERSLQGKATWLSQSLSGTPSFLLLYSPTLTGSALSCLCVQAEWWGLRWDWFCVVGIGLRTRLLCGVDCPHWGDLWVCQ